VAATVTEAGTVTAALLLARLTVNPPLGATALKVTVQATVPAPVSDPLEHESALSAAAGLSCKANVSEMLPDLAVKVAV
jgi:hypothetical protein